MVRTIGRCPVAHTPTGYGYMWDTNLSIRECQFLPAGGGFRNHFISRLKLKDNGRYELNRGPKLLAYVWSRVSSSGHVSGVSIWML